MFGPLDELQRSSRWSGGTTRNTPGRRNFLPRVARGGILLHSPLEPDRENHQVQLLSIVLSTTTGAGR